MSWTHVERLPGSVSQKKIPDAHKIHSAVLLTETRKQEYPKKMDLECAGEADKLSSKLMVRQCSRC